MNDTSWIPADADVVKLETWGTRAHVAKAGNNVGGRHLGRLLSSHIGGGCYILSAATARRLLARTMSSTAGIMASSSTRRMG